MFIYIGEYGKDGDAYNKIYGEVLAKNDIEPSDGYNIEKYVNDPLPVEAHELKTEIYIPIK